MIFVATKVIYDTYSCTISGMSREMVEMDDRNSAECQNWEKRDKMVILEVVKSLNDKIATVAFFFKLERKQKRGGTSSSRLHFLDLQAIQSSAVFWTRRRTALRGEGYA